MTTTYQPELGQAIFGQPTQQYECPQILDAALAFIREELGRVLWNVKQAEWDPFGNRGEAFRCDVFGVWSYDWSDLGGFSEENDSDDSQPYNFCHAASGLCVSWYKYAGRGMSCNRKIDPAEAAVILRICMDALSAINDGKMAFLAGGLSEVPYFHEQARIQAGT